MHRAPWIEVCACGGDRDSDTAAFGLDHVISQGLRHRVERQGAVGKALDEFQSAHRSLLFGTDRAVSFGRHF